MKTVTGILLALGLAGAAQAGAMIALPGDPVTVKGGKVAGTRLESGVRAYLGVPFAKPPVQDLRWKAPEPISWKGVWNADRKGPECIQVLRPHNINHYFGEEPSSEDCLYMNLWAPASAKPGSRLPVIVFIYGGGSTIGSSGMANYDGEAVARRGAIFVNFNYRVGILGFMAHPELSKEQGGHSGDYAYLDQNAALRWIHDNIAAFGGDPDKVVITGQSAGAGSVAAQIFSSMSKGLFRGAMMSSSCNFSGSGLTLQQAEQIGLDVQKRLGAKSLDDMRQVPADKILGLQAETQVGANIPGVRAGPLVDGYFMPKPKLEALEAHAVNDVPIIASSNREDLDASNALVRAKTVAEYKDMAGRMFGADAPAFLALYPVSNDAEVRQTALKAAREMGLMSNNRGCAQLQAKYNKSPAYLDLFTRVQPYAPGVKLADLDPATAGAYHTADIPYWFGTLDKYNWLQHTRDWGPADRKLSEDMMDSLIAFARTGDPSTAAVKWPEWKASSEQYEDFNDGGRAMALNVKGMDWLAAHKAAPVPAPGAPVNAGPRD
ncbi:MAG: carboxylesterase/lipase family protein [Caulobacteraceae bacterium]